MKITVQVFQRLQEIQKGKARPYFNAMRLSAIGVSPIQFKPDKYGSKTTDYQIDHLFPDSVRKTKSGAAGYREADRMGNFAPLEQQDNISAKNKDCSVKLGVNGVYRDPKYDHPFIQFLVTTHFNSFSANDLDDISKLVPNANKNSVFMHCLPAHRNEEVTNELIDGPQSIVWQQAKNRIYVQQSIINYILK